MRKKNQKGFTLVEVIVVCVILGILAAITIPSFYGYMKRSRRDECQVNQKALIALLSSERAQRPEATMEELLQTEEARKIVCPSGGTYWAVDAHTVACTEEDHGRQGLQEDKEGQADRVPEREEPLEQSSQESSEPEPESSENQESSGDSSLDEGLTEISMSWEDAVQKARDYHKNQNLNWFKKGQVFADRNGDFVLCLTENIKRDDFFDLLEDGEDIRDLDIDDDDSAKDEEFLPLKLPVYENEAPFNAPIGTVCYRDGVYYAKMRIGAGTTPGGNQWDWYEIKVGVS